MGHIPVGSVPCRIHFSRNCSYGIRDALPWDPSLRDPFPRDPFPWDPFPSIGSRILFPGIRLHGIHSYGIHSYGICSYGIHSSPVHPRNAPQGSGAFRWDQTTPSRSQDKEFPGNFRFLSRGRRREILGFYDNNYPWKTGLNSWGTTPKLPFHGNPVNLSLPKPIPWIPNSSPSPALFFPLFFFWEKRIIYVFPGKPPARLAPVPSICHRFYCHQLPRTGARLKSHRS